MILARVIGQAVATVKRPQFEGATLLLVQPETPEGVAVGTTLLAVDGVGKISDIFAGRSAGGKGGGGKSGPCAGAGADAAFLGAQDQIRR